MFKFGDLGKAAADVFNNDYLNAGYHYKAKMKSAGGSATATTTMQVFAAADKTTTPMVPDKISMTFAKKLLGLSVSKIELDKKGNINLEVAVDPAVHRIPNMTVDAKSKHVVDPKQATACFKYKVKGNAMCSQVCADVKVAALAKSEVEATVALGDNMTVGVKSCVETLSKPALGARYGCPNAFVALTIKNAPSLNVEAHAFYSAKKQKVVEQYVKDLQLAALCKHSIGGNAKPTFGLGMLCKVRDDCTVKAKVEGISAGGNPVMSASAKCQVSDGCSLLAGCKYDKKASFGLQVGME